MLLHEGGSKQVGVFHLKIKFQLITQNLVVMESTVYTSSPVITRYNHYRMCIVCSSRGDFVHTRQDRSSEADLKTGFT